MGRAAQRECNVAIINYRQPRESIDVARKCLDAGAVAASILIVDNSGDCENLAFEAGLSIVRMNNPGYAAAANFAFMYFEERRPADLLILTPAISSPNFAALLQMNRIFDDHLRCAAVGPVMIDRNVPFAKPFYGVIGRIPKSRRNFESLLPSADNPITVDSLDGACWCLNRKAIHDIGPLDEQFFLYWEETDWCERAKGGSWQVIVDRSSYVEQDAGYMRPSTGYYSSRNRVVVSRKYMRSPGISWAVRTLLRGVVSSIWRAPLASPFRRAQLRGLLHGLANRKGPDAMYSPDAIYSQRTS